MSTKMNKALWALNISLLLGSLFVADAMAAECGQAKLIVAGSTGVNVTKNNCQEQSRLTLGSVLELSSGSRMWVKFDPKDGESYQLICQNKSADTININVASAAMPWIKPVGLKNCEQWEGNKLSCEGREGQKNSFFCAIANVKSGRTSTAPEVTTSVKMRSISVMDPLVRDIAKVTRPVDEIIETIKPDVELCKSLYNISDKLDTSWSVSLGTIKDLVVKSENGDLVSCVEGVVKQANAMQDLSVKYSF